jgi:mannosyltransferase OCH1-like enzyme
MAIPHITHQIWLQGWAEIPQIHRAKVEELHAMNPEFKHMQWDEESLYKECLLLGQPYADKFKSFQNFMAKVDYGRYVVLYHYGGFSIDTDMKPLRPLRETPDLDSAEFIVSKVPFPVSITGFVNNAIFIVRPKHPLMKEIIDTITRSTKTEKDYLTKELFIDNETGPTFINTTLNQHRKRITIMDHEYFEPCYSLDPYCKPTEKSIMDHQHTMSWINPIFKEIFRVIFFMYRFILPLVLVYGAFAYFTGRWPFAGRKMSKGGR